MKKADYLLISGLLLCSLIFLVLFFFIKNIDSDNTKKAKVYYRNEIVLSIDLKTNDYIVYEDEYIVNINENDNTFIVTGTLGEVTIQVIDGEIGVINQTSPKNICQIQGFTDSSLKPITCLPNHVVIVIESYEKEQVDVIVG